MNNPRGKGEYAIGGGLAFGVTTEMNPAWRSVLPLARQMKRSKGEEVEQGKDLLFLDRGRVCLVAQGWDGTEKLIWSIREGCIFGEAPFFDPIPNKATFTCAADCVIYAFSTQAVARISRERPDLLQNLLQTMARKLRILAYHAASLYLDDMAARVCKFLSQRIVPGSSPLTAKIRMSRQEMANLLGMHRISLYKALRQLEERGLLGPTRGKTITILRPQEFYQMVEQ